MKDLDLICAYIYQDTIYTDMLECERTTDSVVGSRWCQLVHPGSIPTRGHSLVLHQNKYSRYASPDLRLQCHVHHPPVLRVITEWTVDVGLLVTIGQNSKIFSTESSGQRCLPSLSVSILCACMM
jgi:hypothetical protein